MSFKFAQITDTHLYGGATDEELPRRDDFLRQFMHEVAGHDIDFFVHTGDMCNNSEGVERHRRMKRVLDEVAEELGLGGYHVTRGNHDYGGPAPTDEQFAEIWGHNHWWFHHKGWAFIGIDLYYRHYPHAGNFFALSPDTRDFVDQALREIGPTTPIVFMLHDPPVGIHNFAHGEEILFKLAEHNTKLILYGHVQGNWISTYHGIPHATVVGESQPFDSSPLSYNIVTCADDGTTTCDFFAHQANAPGPRPVSLPTPGGHAKPHEPWLEMRGPHGRRATDTSLPSDAPTLAWSVDLPGSIGVGAPTLKNGTLFVGTKTLGRFDQCNVHALDAASGAVRWTTPMDGSVEGGVRLQDDKGFCATTNGSLYCLNLRDGRAIWRWNNRENIPITCEPAFDEEDGAVHFGGNAEIYAVDAADGTTLWRRWAVDSATEPCSTYFTAGHGSPVFARGRVIHQRCFGGARSMLQAVDKRTGAGLQASGPATSDAAFKRHASPVLYQQYIIAVGLGISIFGSTGIQKPRKHLRHTQSSATPAIADGIAYVSYHNETVAHDLRNDGQILWRVPTEPALYHFGGYTTFASTFGANPTRGNYAAPLVAGDKVLVADGAGYVRCFQAESGALQWTLDIGSPVLSAPIVSGNTLYFGDYDGRLYAFAW